MCGPLPNVWDLFLNAAQMNGSATIAGNRVVCAQVGDIEFLEIHRFRKQPLTSILLVLVGSS